MVFTKKSVKKLVLLPFTSHRHVGVEWSFFPANGRFFAPVSGQRMLSEKTRLLSVGAPLLYPTRFYRSGADDVFVVIMARQL